MAQIFLERAQATHKHTKQPTTQLGSVDEISIKNLYNLALLFEMKDYVKYLGLMIDSNLSWKYHIESICHKISKSIGIIAKIRHNVPRRILLN